MGSLPFRFEHCECEPTTILMATSLAISAATGVATIQGQKQQASAQRDQQAQLTAANNSVAGTQMSQLRIQQAQSTEAAARDGEKARLANLKAQSTARVAAGEAGVTGNSVTAALQEYGMQFGQYREAVQRQTQLTSQATDTQMDAIRTGARNQALQINAPIAGPNYAAEGLKFAGSALGSYRAYNPSAFEKSPAKRGT
jgi:hypothetical protein